MTTVIVSQRVSTVRDADMICVLDHGSVAGLGTHDELYANCQLYREICQSQLRREEPEGRQGECDARARPKSRVRLIRSRIRLRKGGLLDESVYFLRLGRHDDGQRVRQR